MENLIIVYCTTPDPMIADQIAHELVNHQLAACVSVFPEVSSTYRWQGQVEKAKESLLMIKTKESCFEMLKEKIVALHPYDVPEIIATPIVNGLHVYIDWVVNETC